MSDHVDSAATLFPAVIRARDPDTGTMLSYRVDERGATPLVGGPFGRDGGPPRPLEGLALACPVEPRKIICIGRNYEEHAKELGNTVGDVPTVFEKPVTSLVGPGAPIVRPALSGEVHHEAELAVVIGHNASGLREDEALSVVFGYTCANDVTARDLQRADKGRFTRAKGFDTFCALGPRVVLAAAVADPQALAITCRVQGAVRQQGNTRDMVFPVARLLAYVSSLMRLEAGDVVLTGTPAGVGPLVAGDAVEVSVAGLGTLKNPVINAS